MKQFKKANFRQSNKCFVLVLLLFAAIPYVKAQDIHFSQFFTNPLILNPAQTGYFNGNYRIGFNFKAQWPWAINSSVYNYHTETPYVDFSFGEKKIKSGWMGIGLNFLNDEAGDGILTYRRFSASYAYHQAFDKDMRYILSVGVQASYIIRSVDFSKFYFNDQWVADMGFDRAVNSNENFQRQSFGMFDLGAGLNVGAQVTDKAKLDVGFSMLHINRPKDAFYNDAERLGFRYQVSAGMQYTINERLTVNANAYYGYEKKASEIMLGAMVGYGFYSIKKAGADNVLYIGAYYRIKDALAPLIGYQFRTTRLLLSYDVTFSKLFLPGKANGGPELSIVHVGSFTREFNGKKVFCPRF
ncbi:MAG TPA: PorP/SprF family type IX secretion system membrane protein [Chitinophagales bacterium]|nr:PorP/SprF family type IX secretion system membrane protein [Chitinophagales bacterium]